MKGIDYGFSPHPTITAIKDAGVTFVMRYISDITQNDSNGKNLIPAEKKNLLGAGLALGVVYETFAGRMKAGKPAGVHDATFSDAVVKALGMPGLPVYFAADWDATPADQTAINAYLDGAASVIGRARVGIYGGYYPVKRALDAGKATYAWQTYAWSGGQWDSRAHIRQVLNGVKLGGADVDNDMSMQADFGQWPRPSVPETDTYRHVADGTESLAEVAAHRHTTEAHIVEVSNAHMSAANIAALANYVAEETELLAAAKAAAADAKAAHDAATAAEAAAAAAAAKADAFHMQAGLVYWTTSSP